MEVGIECHLIIDLYHVTARRYGLIFQWIYCAACGGGLHVVASYYCNRDVRVCN